MRSRRSIAYCLVAVHVVLAANMVARASYWDTSWSREVSAGIRDGQSALLAMWLPNGSLSWVRRLAIYFVVGTFLTATALPLSLLIEYPRELLFCAATPMFMMIPVTLPLLVLRRRGWQLTRMASSEETDEREWQWESKTLFILMLVVALQLTLHKMAVSIGEVQSDGRVGFRSESLLLGLVLVIVNSILLQAWCVVSLTKSCLAERGVLVQFVSGLVALGLFAALPLHAHGGVTHVAWCVRVVLFAATVTGTLLAIRPMGVRYVRRTAPL